MQFKDDSRNRQLTKDLKNGNKAAFNTLFYTFEPRLYAYVVKLTRNPEDAKEVVQEVFLKVWEKRENIDLQFSFDSFLYTIAKNLVYNKAKHNAYYFAYKEYVWLNGCKEENFTENMVHFNELEKLIKSTCMQLPPIQRKVFMLSRIEGLSNKEIAEQLNTSISNVKNHIYKALLFLKKQIRIHEIIPLIMLFLSDLNS